MSEPRIGNPQTLDLASIQRLDAEDALRGYRNEFHLPASALYFAGHSLGPMPRSARSAVLDETEAWAKYGVEGHFCGDRPWFSYHEQLAVPLAELVGAQASEVVAMNSLTVNLHLLLASFYRPTATRNRILIEGAAFPSDRYAVESQLRWHGIDPAHGLAQMLPRPGETLLRTEDVLALLEREGKSIAVVLLPGVQYLTGQCLDLRMLASAARAAGCCVGIDLAHAIGNVPLALHDWDVDFAVWCSYKYLNGGPGAPGGAFVHERHARSFELPRLAGWWGHDKSTRLAMPDRLKLLPGAEGWQISNPPILAMAPLRASLQIFQRATLPTLRDKSLRMTNLLAQLVEQRLAQHLEIVTPDSPARGAQLSLRLKGDAARGKALHEQLVARRIVCDWREPDILRVAPVPLYNTYEEVWTFVAALTEILG